MEIIDNKTKTDLSNITLYLTASEAQEMVDALDAVLNTESHHEHVSNQDYTKEVTVTIYDKNSIDTYDEDSRRRLGEPPSKK